VSVPAAIAAMVWKPPNLKISSIPARCIAATVEFGIFPPMGEVQPIMCGTPAIVAVKNRRVGGGEQRVSITRDGSIVVSQKVKYASWCSQLTFSLFRSGCFSDRERHLTPPQLQTPSVNPFVLAQRREHYVGRS